MRDFLKTLFSDSASVSFSRISAFIVLIFSLAWVSVIVCKTHVIPPLKEIALFIIGLYGMGKVNETIQKFQ
jgi:hypothetical protein